MKERLWCIVPFSRPQYAQAIFDRFKRQTYKNKKLIIVENGDGIGSCKKLGLEPDILLSSGKHQSWAKNEAILYLQKMGHSKDWWTTWDDDDYYGDFYLEELSRNLNKGEVIGKSKSFIKLTDDRLYLMDKPPENEYIRSNEYVIHGPTITARVGECLFFEHLEFAEDLKFVDEMRELGANVWATSKYNWCYYRNGHGNHTWRISDDEFKFANSGAFIDYGPLNHDIVDGKVKIEGKIIYCDTLDLKSSFVYQEVMKNTGGSPDKVLGSIAKQLFGDKNED